MPPQGNNIPPPPSGYTMDAVPPPPEGYVLDQHLSPEARATGNLPPQRYNSEEAAYAGAANQNPQADVLAFHNRAMLSGLTGTPDPSFTPYQKQQFEQGKAAGSMATPAGGLITAGSGAVDIGKGNIARGGHKVISGLGTAALPFIPGAIASAPLKFALAAGGGYLGGKAAGKIAKSAGGSEDVQNLAQDVGGLGGAVLGGGAPSFLRNIKSAFPNKPAAGALFSEASSAAGETPIDLSRPGNTALKIKDMSEAGGSMPKVIRDFIRRNTDPSKPPLTYDEARQFYSNASRLSADEGMRLTPQMKRMLGQFTNDLGESISQTAEQAGVGPQYQGAMKQYRQAAKLEDMVDSLKKNAIKIGLGAAGTGAAAYTLRQMLPFLRQNSQ